MEWEHGIVSRDPDVLNGDLVFALTRVPVKNLVDYLVAGDTLDEFLDDLLGVSREQAVAHLEMSHKTAEETVGASSARWRCWTPAQAMASEEVIVRG